MSGIPVRALNEGNDGQFLGTGPEGFPLWLDLPTAFFKEAVRMASTENLVATRDDRTLTADSTGALGAIDDVTPVVGDRVLLKDQDTGADMGIYTIVSLGSMSTKWVMTRATDFDSSEKIKGGLLVPVSEGTLAGNKTWQLTTNDPIVLNTDALSFSSSVTSTLSDATPQAVGAAAPGNSTDASRANHVHAHGNQLGGALHANADGSTAGFITAALFTMASRIKVATKAVGFADITDAGTSHTIDFAGALPAGAYAIGAMAVVSAAFDNVGNTASVSFDLGIKSGDTDCFLAAASANAAASVYTPQGVGAGSHAGHTGTPGFAGGATPSLIFTGDVNLDTLTKGALVAYVYYLDFTTP